MHKSRRFRFLLMAALAAALFLGGLHSRADAAGKANQQMIFQYLTETMDLPEAAACGIMANIRYESDFNPRSVGDHGTSYGICQWHKSRFTALKNYCSRHKLDYQTLRGQLEFLNYELRREYGRIYRYMKHVSNDAYGAYQAGYYWCYHFERPARYLTASVKRGNAAREKYWPRYSELIPKNGQQAALKPPVGEEIQISKTAVRGERIAVTGSVLSDGKLDVVKVGIFRIDGTEMSSAELHPEANRAELSDAASALRSSELDAGAYILEVTAANAAGTEQLARQAVSILPRTSSYASANIRIRMADTNTWLLGAVGTENPSVQVTRKDRDGNTLFQMIQQPNGCYSIRSLSADRYVTLASDGRIVLESWKGEDAQLWMILSAGDKLRMILPKTDPSKALSASGAIVQGAGLICEDTVQNEKQLFRLIVAEDDTPLVDPSQEAKKRLTLEVSEEDITAVEGSDEIILPVYSNGELSYDSSHPEVAQAVRGGRLLIRGVGETDITIRAALADFKEKSAVIHVRVLPQMKELEDVIGTSFGTGNGSSFQGWNEESSPVS